MKYRYTRRIEVSVEGELPLLGYDIKKGVQSLHSLTSTEALRLSLSDSRERFHLDIGGERWEVKVEEEVRRKEDGEE